jgi:DNA-binding NarL/FixJ family response regulator
MLRLLIVSKVCLYREGLTRALETTDTLHVVAQLSDQDRAVAYLGSDAADVVVVDVATADGARLVSAIRMTVPDTPIVALGASDSDADVLSWVESGVAAYVTQDASLHDLIAAIHGATRGEFFCSPRLAGRLVRRVADLAAVRHVETSDMRLTRRECEIGNLLEQHLSNKEIAARLGIEVATVKNHVHNLLDKLGVHRRTQAARLLHRVLR